VIGGERVREDLLVGILPVSGKNIAVLFCALWAVFVYSGLNLYEHLTSFVADLVIY